MLPSASRLLPALLALAVVAGCEQAPEPDLAANGAAADTTAVAGGLRRDLLDAPDRGQTSARLRLDLGVGRVSTAAAEPGALFQAEVTLPPGDLRAVLTDEGDADAARLALRLAGSEASIGDLRRGGDVAWRLRFGTRVPLDLSARLGAADATLDLTGVPLSRLALTTGVGRTTLRLTAPNPAPSQATARLVEIEAGAGDLRAEGLGFARFDSLRFRGGVGRFALDLRGGTLPPGAHAELRVGLGRLDVILPAGQALVVETSTSRLASVELPPGLVTLGGGRYATPGAGEDALTVRILAASGAARVRIE